MRIVRVVLHFIDVANERFGKIVSFLTVFMIGVITVEVVLRYVFNSPTLWAHETAQFLYGSYCILGGAYVLLNKAHVNMDVIYARLSTRARAILDVITSPLFFLFIVVMLWHGVFFAEKSVAMLEHTQTPWGPPIWPIKLMLPLAAFLFLLQGIAKLVRDIETAITGRETGVAPVAKKELL